jgi:lysine-ketoglutarate reductase/saccharopine dehydrogenase-like protein (TIGR00300 family)
VETFEVEGHIVDSLILAKVLDLILDAEADYRLLEVDIGKTSTDTSRAVIEITAVDDATIGRLAEQLQVHGVNPVGAEDAELVAADLDGVLPAGFYSTTNLPSEVRLDGHWVPVENPEMDCGLVVTADGPDSSDRTVRTVPMHRVRVGDRIVVGNQGVRVQAPQPSRGLTAFEFMDSEVSSEKPKGLQVRQVAEKVRAAREAGSSVLAVCGPAVIHTGGGPDLARLVRGGWIQVLFAGNGFATHDMESNVLGTSLGVSVAEGAPTEGGHSNHLRVINEVRRHGSIAAAVEDGFVTGGVMYECVQAGVPFVLGGSIRDDGPLPDTVANVVEAADRMRELVPGVTVALMLATTLHAIATGNILPAGVETFCADINQAVVTKLADRGSHQAHGIVTDVGLFVHQLADELEAPR